MKYLVKNRLLYFYLRCIELLPIFCKRVAPKYGRVLLSNIAHLGDVVIASCAVNMIKAAYPKAEIAFLTSSASKVVLEGVCPLHVFDHFKHNRAKISLLKKLYRHGSSFLKAILEIRKQKYDLFIDLYPFYPNAIALSFLCGIPSRMGYTSGGYGKFLTHPVDFCLEKDRPLARYYNDLLGIAGLFKPALLLSRSPIEGQYIVFHPGAGNPSKEWGVEGWRDLLKHLSGKKVVFTGQGEREDKMIKEIDKNAISLSSQLSFKDLTSLVARASLVVCVDTAIQHIAAAFDTPTVTLYIEKDDFGLFHGDSSKCRALIVKKGSILSKDLVDAIVKQLFI